MSNFHTESLTRANRLAERWVEDDVMPAVVMALGGSQGEPQMTVLGHQDVARTTGIQEDSIFLIASPTKPIAAIAVLQLLEQGEFLLADPVSKFIPDFAQNGKSAITIGHCLTHTSGLPDMLPNNVELRKEQAPLSEFAKSTCQIAPLFAAGTRVRYQSTGLLMLAQVVEKIAGDSLPNVLQKTVFGPLGMNDTALGMPADWETASDGGVSRLSRIAESRVAKDANTEWGWNSLYWRRLGAPWGGLLASAPDWAKLCRHLLEIHRGKPDGILAPATLRAMTRNQLQTMDQIPEVNRRCTPWGYGWQPNWPNHPRTFGDLLTPGTYGHWGATGTMIWIDPSRDVYAVVLTTEPLEDTRRRLALMSNTIASAICYQGNRDA